jgi:NAD(P)-dependent dehydrogenase (short-subunit alcohol dehydrogenase family)
MFDLTGKSAVVTGASSGIGQAIAIALAEAGANVASLYLTDPEGAAATAAAIGATGREALMRQGDTADPAQVESLATDAESRWGGLDIWVNNAAKVVVKPFLEISDADWRDVLSVNLDGYFHGCRAAARRMVPRGRGRIVNIASVTYHQPSPGMATYVASKGGVVGLTRVLGLELAPLGICVNSVSPGTVDTAMNAGLFTPAVRKVFDDRIAVGRIGAGRDIASAVLYFCSDEAAFVTGQDLLVDGGMALNGDVGIQSPGA